MVDYCVYAWDICSTSKLEDDNFRMLDTLSKFYMNVEKIQEERLVAAGPQRKLTEIFMHWNGNVRGAPGDTTTSEDLHQNNEFGKKKPDWIIRCLKDEHHVTSSDKIELLYIVTDGAISKESVEKCIELNEDIHYETVVFHAFNENPKKIDLSVAAPFFKSRCMVYRNNELCYSADISKKFDYDKINADNFLAKKDQLKSYIKLKYINKSIPDASVPQEVNKLTMLRDRLVQEFKSEFLKYICPSANLEATEKNSPTPEIDSTPSCHLFFASISDEKEVDETFAAMLAYIENNKNSYSFDALKFDTKVDKPVAEEPMDNADSADEDANFMDDDAESINDDDDDADFMDDDAESIHDDDDDADFMDDDADDRDHKEMKFIKILLKREGGISIFIEYINIMYG
uniref:P94-like protein n=1 Tax=Glyptapanteles flavicoxis TaxID=463051 RepID=B7S8H1_9HYME|nr:conserved hypothetical protein [Glyptapanteles flavicoxis]